MTDRLVHVIWCDDIRQEVGNKPSFMGVYTAGITVPTLPALLDRLALHVWAYTPKDKPFKSITVSVQRDDGHVLASISTSPNDTGDAASEIRLKRPGSTIQSMMFGIGMAGIELPVNCKYLTVKIEAEGDHLEGQKLWIDTFAPASPEGENV